MTITVTSTVREAIVSQSALAHPFEACGLLFGTDTNIDFCEPTANVHPEPERHFEIDPQALIDAHRAMRSGGPQLVGCYHSHPHGSPEPSATDHALAAADGMIWAIVGAGRVTWWRAGHGGLTPLPILVTDA